MRIFKLPDLGEGLQEAEIVTWHVKPGDTVAVDQPLASVETAKAIVDIPSPYAGKIVRLYGDERAVARVGQPLVAFEGGDDADTGTVVGKMEVGQKVIAEAPAAATALAHGIKATPAVRALARKLNVDLAMVTPTGADGLITSNDVQRAARILAAIGPQELLRGVRKVMAQSMTLAHAEVASATLMDDADIDAWPTGTNVMLRLVRALVAACKVEPSLNAWYDSQAVGRRLLKNVDIGIAVDTPDGLLVPVLRNVEQRPAGELSAALLKLIRDTRERKVPPEDLRANTITLSNFGPIGGRYASPIVLPPTVAIVGAGRMRKEVVVFNDQPAVHRVLPLSVTFDHRAVTGGEAGRFMAAMIADLERAD
ncbi:MAG: Dihydrolipoamide acyltransferase component of branched-chain alpha-keto acid dehydrogenase complex [Betaproteobacteria bacterium]|nr:Dihydrolipoamide acyltransferase component of branched-chain alpha-keto acid dehydrogenase complex [Betaproteobacteria bacterium]